MRILFLTNELGTGGAEKLTVAYALGMSARGHEIAVAFGFNDSQAEPLREAGIDLTRLSTRALSTRTLAEWVRQLRKESRQVRPEVIHAQSVASAVAARLALPTIPLLVTIHGISKANEPLASLLLRAANVRLTAVSRAAAAGLLRHPWAPPIDILEPGLDAERIAYEATTGDPPNLIGDPRIVCVARQDLAKGIDVLLHAFPAVIRAFPRAGLTLVGTGRELKTNSQIAASLGLTEHIRFVGSIPYAAPYIGSADIVVLPSRREGLPVVALEALALARPLVATDVGGTSRVVIDGKTGWLVPPEDPDALAAAIVECAGDPAEGGRRALAGRDLVQRSFSSDAMLDAVEGLLEDLSRKAKSVPPLKARAYHRTVRAHQRVRIAVWKRRSRSWAGVRIFGYHRISDSDDFGAVSTQAFRYQMEHLRNSDLDIVPLSQALDLVEQPVEGRYACVTFDDGYLDTLEVATPILADLDIPSTVFLIADALEGKVAFDWYQNPPPAIQVEHLPRLLASGLVEVQAHSRTHRRLTLLSDEELRDEVAGSKASLEQYVPTPTSFSYPAGIYGSREVRAVLDAGFRAGVTTAPGVNPGSRPLGELRRTMLYWRDDLESFVAKLDGALDRPTRLDETIRARRARAHSLLR